nr:hypothetical protein [Tanacetum cinerariifolium]
MVDDLRYFNSLESEVDSLTSQLETQQIQFMNEIDRLSREYFYADHMNAILGVYTELDEVTNLQYIGTSSLTGRYLTQKEAAKEALTLRISQKFTLLEEVRLVLETMAYHDKYKKVLDEIWKDKVELDGMIVKEEEEAINKVKGELGREEIKKIDRGIIMINHTQAEAMGILMNVLYQEFQYTIRGIVNTPERLFSTFNGICHQTFRAVRSDVLRAAESVSNDDEEYEIKRNKFGVLIYGLKPAAYLNYNDQAERSLALQAVINPFQKISVWK